MENRLIWPRDTGLLEDDYLILRADCFQAKLLINALLVLLNKLEEGGWRRAEEEEEDKEILFVNF